ncbi:sodium leak channel NALCN-like isoform X2 [Clavelina lepadiformis]|uniref:sodium leak channel NALCN-like isoform X2 n=1 Tax=Clavelina lepadiformis TaxID=159417 RepID=UPI0040434FB6
MEETRSVLWIEKPNANRLFLICAVLSFVSVSCNTPRTFEEVPQLKYGTIIVDVITAFILTVEALAMLRIFYVKKEGCLKKRWSIFDGFMAFFIWISVLIQLAEFWKESNFFQNTGVGLLRLPRALILLRVFRHFNFQFDSSTLTIIVMRAGHQIGGVTLFLLFFLLLYGLLGVQLFGSMSHHCVLNGTDSNNVTLANLAIPDTLCSKDDFSMCPPTFVCMSIALTIKERGYGAFDNIVTSIKTVYEAASQEGWVFLMYKNIDSYTDWHSYVYFFSLIFFLAWLVKNVFIAVIIETFAEIRVQLHNLWGNLRYNHQANASHVIMNDENFSVQWKIVDINMRQQNRGTLDTWKEALRSRWYHLTMLVAIVLNVGISAFQPRIEGNIYESWSFFRIAELFFTVIFDVECAMKIICLGIPGYFKRNINKYEVFLALMTTINTAYSFPALRSIPVFRVIRLVKLSPTLENFVYKIFGPAKKIGLLVGFTLGILTLMSTISLQMLCYVKDLEIFSTFPNAFVSMFQIMTQEGWIDVMHKAMDLAGYQTFIPVSVYFILYHLFVTTVMISLFVAVILDNLELDENLKRLKQLKVNEQSVDIKQPFRLRVFEQFPNRPDMVHVSKMPSEFVMPRLRNSFLRQFINTRLPVGLTFSACHITGLPPYVHTYSSSCDVVTSAVLASQLALPQDGSYCLITKEDAMYESNFKMQRKPNFRSRLLWRRSHMISKKEKANIKCGMNTLSTNRKNQISHLSEVTNMAMPVMLESLMRDCCQQATNTSDPALSNYSSGHSTSLLSTQHLMRRERRYFQTNRQTLHDGKQKNNENIRTSDSLYSQKAQQELDFKLIHVKRQQAILKRQRQEQELRENHPFFDKPLLFIKRDSQIRKFCQTMVYAQYGKSNQRCVSDVTERGPMQVIHDLLGLVCYLDWVMILVTVISCSSMMMESSSKRVHETPFLQIAEYLFVVAMGCELLLKIFSNGLFFTPKPTFKDLGGFLDATIFLVSLIFICNLQSLRGHSGQSLMVLRCLRPLRIFKLVPQIKKVVVELFRGFKEIVMVGILLVALMFVFASFGVQVYGGKLAACNDDSITTEAECSGKFYQQVWVSNSLNMDLNPSGVVIANYNENKGAALLTVDQRRWEDLKSRLKIAQPLHLPPRPLENDIRAKFYDLAEHPYFKWTIASCVMIRSLLLSWKWESHHNQEFDYAKYLVWSSICLTFVFVLEIVVKVIGMTFLGMMSSWRNRYDVLVTMLEIGWVFMYFISSDEESVYSSGWILVAFRFFSICGKHATLKMLLTTVAVSVYRSFFIIVAMFILLLCYAYAGVVLFGTVKYGENIDRHANFSTVPLAVTVLFRIVTGEDWNKIMHDCMILPPRCTPADHYWETDCGNVLAARMYFCSFYIIIAYIMLNLLVAIIVENFSLFYTMDEDILLSYNDLHMFQVTWNMYRSEFCL